MSGNEHDRLLVLAHQVVDDVRDLFLADDSGEHTSKGDRDFATEVDYAIERTARGRLSVATPDIGFVGEEDGGASTGERWWCLDPIDGTVNYANGSPLCAISLALIEDGAPVLGVIDAPRLGVRYAASVGNGSTRNDASISAASLAGLGDAIVSFGDFTVDPAQVDRLRWQQAVLLAAAERAQRIRMIGTAALDLAWLADGTHGATIIIGGKSWDVAAGQIIAQEAGANILQSPFTGSDATIACAPGLEAEITALLPEPVREPR